MGIPYFKVKDTLTKRRVTLFSGNFALYGDISRRIMSIIEEVIGNIEVYSIDEAFVRIDGDENDARQSALALRKAIEQGTGVPVSIGIARTKTLAKLASEVTKKHPEYNGVFLIDEHNRETLLKETPIGEIWGVGGKTSIKLTQHAVTSAFAFSTSGDAWIQSTLGIGGLRIAQELRGIRSILRDSHMPVRKSILSSRSFGEKTSRYGDLERAVSSHIVRATQKMRAQNNGAGFISVSIRSRRQGPMNGTTYSGFRSLSFPTQDTLSLIDHALSILAEIYKEGVVYEKAGILLSSLVPAEEIPQASLFGDLGSSNRQLLMKTIDAIDKKYGKNTLFPAIMGTEGVRGSSTKSQFSSPARTTDWGQIPRVRA